MAHIIALGGEPGAGKSTLMKKVIEKLGITETDTSVKLVPFLKKDNVYILGKYEEGEVFSGTDRLSMACQPEVVKFLNTIPEDSVVYFEGDRLFNGSFLEYCVNNHKTRIIYLKTDKKIRLERYEERGSNQNDVWLQGRETKISNILSNFFLMDNLESYSNNNLEDQNNVLSKVLEF